jgi:hypothetical protein
MKRPRTSQRPSWRPSRSGSPKLPLGFRDVVIIGAVLAVVVAALVGHVIYFPPSPKPTHPTFGPDWDCTFIGYSGPVCVKRIGAAK